MPLLGPGQLSQVAIPAAWDAAELANLALRDGRSYLEVLNDLNDALLMVQEEVEQSEMFDMIHTTPEVEVEYRSGTSNGFEDHTENAQPDAARGDTSGHMLPIKKKDRKLDWTTDFLEAARAAQLDADVADATQDYRDVMEQTALSRFFKKEADSGKQNGLGATGLSLPFVDGSSAGSISFTPIRRPDRANAFTSSHNHYLRLDGLTQANVETAVQHLWEHGHDAPFNLVASESDLQSWTDASSVTGFVTRDMGLVSYGNDTSLAQVGQSYQGVIKTKRGPCRLMTNARIPSGYWGLTKVYGKDDQRNPLARRIDPMYGKGPKLVVERVSLYPLTGGIVVVKFGYGIGKDRTNGVLVRSGAAYASPTIA